MPFANNQDFPDNGPTPRNFWPDGQWSGFYLEALLPRRNWMNLFLQFHQGTIHGEGTDYVGPWHLAGTYDPASGHVEWRKQYLGKHAVMYRGKASDQGIRGTWSIGRAWQGPFHIWPGNLGELGQRYLREDELS